MNLTIEEQKEVIRVMESQMLTLLHGEYVKKFEKDFARYHGVKHAIGVNTGTAALHIAIAALDIFADIDNKSYTLDPKSVKEKITDKTKAIIPVHLAGIAANMKDLKEIANDYGIFIIEDACQSLGAKCNNKKVGSIGEIGCFSFYPSKNITTGEGGMIITNSDDLAEQCKLIRHHGEPSWYVYNRLGYNYRMTEIQGAIGGIQLTKIDDFIKIRNENARYLTEGIQNVEGIDPPFVPKYCDPAFNYWIGRINPSIIHMNKMEFIDKFPKSKILYPKPLYKTKLFQEKIAYPKGCPWSCPYYGRDINYKDLSLPIVEQVANEIFALDIHPKISREILDENIATIKNLANK